MPARSASEPTMDAAMGEARDGPRSTVRFNNTKHSAADRRSPIRTHNSTYGRQPTLEQNLAYERPVESLAYCINAQDTNIRELTTASLTRLRGIKDVMAGLVPALHAGRQRKASEV